ncbi:hypothetical protein CsatB_026196 [Cannabis sativa]
MVTSNYYHIVAHYYLGSCKKDCISVVFVLLKVFTYNGFQVNQFPWLIIDLCKTTYFCNL